MNINYKLVFGFLSIVLLLGYASFNLIGQKNISEICNEFVKGGDSFKLSKLNIDIPVWKVVPEECKSEVIIGYGSNK